jgi:tRNA(Ile)-lysidine synthase
MECFEEKILDQIQSNGLFEEIDRVLLAVSGGADSVAMAYALSELRKKQLFSCEFIIGHVNHCLRGAHSDADEAFVKELADSFSISVITKAVDVKAYAQEHKLSIETAGRTLRLNTLTAMADGHDCDCIATAHHKDDLAETMIHRLMRGTGFRGLCGIWPVSYVYNGQFVRPMLGVRRKEIIQYCNENNIRWREDVSNKNTGFTRNRIRHSILPVIEKESENLTDLLAALSLKSRRFLLWTEKHARAIIAKGRLDRAKEEFVLEKALLEDCPPWVVYEVLREVLMELGVGLRDYTQQHFDAIGEMVKQEKVKADFPAQVEIAVNNGTVLIQLKKEQLEPLPKSVTFQIGQTVEFGQWKISFRQLDCSQVDLDEFSKTKNPFVERFDANKIKGPLIVRQRLVGDRFYPIGGSGEKKVARFLQDAQLDGQTKQQAFIIKDLDKILWVAPVRMSDQFKITSETRQIVEIRISELKSHN